MNPIKLVALLLSVIGAFYTHSAAGEIYKWTDEQGVTHYSQRKPVDTDSETVTTKTKGKKPPNYIPFSEQEAAAERAAAEKKPATKAPEARKPDNKQPVAESKPKNEIKRDPATCDRAKKDEIALRNNPIVRQGGRILTIEEKNQQLANILEIKKIHCK